MACSTVQTNTVYARDIYLLGCMLRTSALSTHLLSKPLWIVGPHLRAQQKLRVSQAGVVTGWALNGFYPSITNIILNKHQYKHEIIMFPFKVKVWVSDKCKWQYKLADKNPLVSTLFRYQTYPEVAGMFNISLIFQTLGFISRLSRSKNVFKNTFISVIINYCLRGSRAAAVIKLCFHYKLVRKQLFSLVRFKEIWLTSKWLWYAVMILSQHK